MHRETPLLIDVVTGLLVFDDQRVLVEFFIQSGAQRVEGLDRRPNNNSAEFFVNHATAFESTVSHECTASGAQIRVRHNMTHDGSQVGLIRVIREIRGRLV